MVCTLLIVIGFEIHSQKIVSVFCNDQLNVNANPGDMESKKADLLHATSITFDASTLSLTFSATVEYVGNSSDGSFNDDFNLGVCRWMK